MRKKPKIGDIVKSTVLTENIAGYVVGVEGIHIWVRYFDDAPKGASLHRKSCDVYTRRSNVRIVSHARD